MTTQAYYKDRLGFDPAEDQIDSDSDYNNCRKPASTTGNSNDRHHLQHHPNLVKSQQTNQLLINGYEESLCKFKDERDAIQKKTFTKWVNKHLKKVRRFVNDLFEDLRDGHNLISLLEVLSRDSLPREKGAMRFHMLQNIETALHFLHCKKIKLVNIRSEDIVDGNPKLILGLIWTIILHFQNIGTYERLKGAKIQHHNINVYVERRSHESSPRQRAATADPLDLSAASTCNSSTSSFSVHETTEPLPYREQHGTHRYERQRQQQKQQQEYELQNDEKDHQLMDSSSYTASSRSVKTKIIKKIVSTTQQHQEDFEGKNSSEMNVSEHIVKQHHQQQQQQQHHGELRYENTWKRAKYEKISDVVGGESDMSAREVLLKWAQKTTSKYPNVHITDFTSSWRDGLALSAIVHRNRPDLIDWKVVKSCKSVRERLEYVFHVIEKECGVTRLLDPEDVDTSEPDEKSIITYVSSIYNVFPEPPNIHPLYDTKSQQKYYEYREIAYNLNVWMNEKCSVMQDYSFPNNLVEMRKVEKESARFRNEEVAQKQRDKQRLHHLYKDVEKYFESSSGGGNSGNVAEMIESEFQLQSIEKLWTKLMILHEEREKSLMEETKRLEKLQRLAEKVNREIKYTESRLENLEKRVEDDSRRVDRLHPLEAKQAADILEQDILSSEKIIQNLFSDVSILKEGNYVQSVELLTRVQQLHQQWVKIRSMMHSKILSKLAHLTFPVEERTVTKQTRTVLETRLVDTNPYFKQLQDCLEWCRKKSDLIQESEYGSDLMSVQKELDHFEKEAKSIDQFGMKVENCSKAKINFSGDELMLYNQYLNQLQKLYSDLSSKTNARLHDLGSLMDFIKSATNELSWLNEKEEIEIARDWADRNLNCSLVEQYYENLMNELEKRELQFTAVQDRGEAMVLANHPASKCIEAHMSAMQSQWAWLLQLTLCLEVHLKHAIVYQTFYSDVKQAEKWLIGKDELLYQEFSQSEFSLDEGEKLLQGMQTLRDELNNFGDNVQSIIQQGQQVVPLKLRRQPVTRPIPIQSICNYKQSNVVIKKGEHCTLVDNSGRIKWKVRNSRKEEANVPGVCFVIPAPDKEATDASECLRRQYDRTITLWQKKQLRMRQNMIFATIKVVKSWDLSQFIAIGGEQRKAIRKALNEDAEKLLAEGDPSDPQLKRLRREMDEVNRLFDDLEKQANAEQSVDFDSILNAIEEAHSILSDFEMKLSQFEEFPTTESGLELVHDKLLNLQSDAGQQQIAMDQLNDDYDHLRSTIEKSRSFQAVNRHGEFDRIIRDINQLNQRWKIICDSISERLKCCELAYKHLKEYNRSKEEEEKWLDDTFNKLRNLTPVREQLDAAKNMMTNTIDRVPKIEGVNMNGGKLIREGKKFIEQLNLSKLRTFRTEFQIIDSPQQNGNVSNSTKPDDMNLVSSEGIKIEVLDSKTSFNSGRLKKRFKVYENVSTESIVDMPGILHPCTGEVLTVGDAISLRILDVRSGKIVASPDGTTITIDEAAKQSIIDLKLAEKLKSPCGIFEQGRPISLLEAIQNELYSNNGASVTGGLVRSEHDQVSENNEYGGKGTIDVHAMENKFLVFTEINLKSDPISLIESLRQNLIDIETGLFYDRNSGDFCRLSEAVANLMVSGNVREIVDCSTDSKITLSEAIEKGIVNAENGTYIINGDRISLDEAQKRHLICKPKTLKDICDENILVDCTKIYSPLKLSKLNLLEATSRGILDSDSLRQVLNKKTNTLVSLKDALQDGIICLDMKYSDNETGEICTIPEAVDRGYLVSVTKRSLFDIECFKYGENYVSFNTAKSKCLISKSSSGFFTSDSRIEVPFDKLRSENLVKPDIFKIFRQKIGIFVNGKELSILEAVTKGFIDSKSGNIVDRETKKTIPVNEAINSNLITKEGALLLANILSMNVTILSPSKTVHKYCGAASAAIRSISNSRSSSLSSIAAFTESIRKDLLEDAENNVPTLIDGSKMNIFPNPEIDGSSNSSELPKDGWFLCDAIKMNYFNPISGLFIIPGTDRLVSFEECLKLQIINPLSAYVVDKSNNRKLSLSSAMEKRILNSLGCYNLNGSVINMKEAIDQNLIVIVRKNQKLFFENDSIEVSSFEETENGSFKDILIHGEDLAFNFTMNVEQLSRPTRLQQLRKKVVSIREALDLNLIDEQTYRMLQANQIDYEQGKIFDQQRLEFVNLNEAMKRQIFDPNNPSVILVPFYRSLSIPEVIEQGLLDIELNRIVHPETGESLTLQEAIICHIVDPYSLIEVPSQNGQAVWIQTAIENGLIHREESTVNGFSLWEANQQNYFVKKSSNESVVENKNQLPKTGMTFLTAFNRGLVDLRNRTIQHPITMQSIDLSKALNSEFIMVLPYPEQKDGSLLLNDAIDLIDGDNGTVNLPNGEIISLESAISQGKLIIRNLNQFLDSTEIVESSTFIHTITTKSIDLVTGYTLKSLNEVQNLRTGQVISFGEAKCLGIIKSESENSESFPQKDNNDFNCASSQMLIGFNEAVNCGYVDVNLAVVKNIRNNEFVALKEFQTNNGPDLDKIEIDLSTFSKRVGSDLEVVKPIRITDQYSLYVRKPYSFKEIFESEFYDSSLNLVNFPNKERAVSLNEAIECGLIETNSIRIKDLIRQSFISFDEALQRGLLNFENGHVLDTSTLKAIPFSVAIQTRLMLTAEAELDLIELLKFNCYDSDLNLFKNPFDKDDSGFTLEDCLENRKLNVNLSLLKFKDVEEGNIYTLRSAVEKGLLSGCDFVKKYENGLVITTESRQAVEEKYKLCEEQLSKLLEWISQVEQKLASQGVLSEDEAELRNQINNMKQIKDDLFSHTSNVNHCADRIRQLILTAGDSLSKSETANLEKSGRLLKSRFDQTVDKNDRLLKCMYQSLEDLHKFRKELASFAAWLDKARRRLEDKEQLLSDLSHLSSNYENVKDFVSDVIAHQADLRFITISAQKFSDDSKDYLKMLNEYRTSLPQRLAHLKAASLQDSKLHSDVSYVTAQYKDLSSRTNALSDRMLGVGSKQKEYTDSLNKATKWMKDAEPRCLKILSEKISADPKVVESQLSHAKILANEFINQGRLLDGAKNALESLLNALNSQLLPEEVKTLESPVINLINKYNQLNDALSEKCQDLDNALIQSQGLQSSLDSVVDWLTASEAQLKGLNKTLASLIKQKLEKQIHEHKLFESELLLHQSSIDSVSVNAEQMATINSSTKMGKKIETQLNDMKTRYASLMETTADRKQFLSKIHSSLCDFLNDSFQLNNTMRDILMSLQNADESGTNTQEAFTKKDSIRSLVEDTIKKGKDLLAQKNVTDVANVRDTVSLLENQWKELNSLVDDKQKLMKQRAEKLSTYEQLREQVIDWLNRMEKRVSSLESISIHSETLNKQLAELKPISKEFREYESTIKKTEEAGLHYDSLAKNSPIKKPLPRHKLKSSSTIRTRSPSPSPLPRATATVSANITGATNVQQQLSDIHNRYNLLGVRIDDRQSELNATKDDLRKCNDSMTELRQFLDKTNGKIPKDSDLPSTKEDAENIMKQMKVVLEEIYEKQSMLDSTKSQIRDLLKRYANSKGSEVLSKNILELSNNWKQTHQNCKEKIQLMENIKEFCDVYDLLNLWLLSKSRMLAVLGPISSDSRIVQSQVQQVQLLKEEFRVQKPQLQHILNLVENIKSTSRSKNCEKIKEKAADIEKRWTKLLKELEDRALSLGTAVNTSREFDDSLNRLRESLQSINDQLDEIAIEKDKPEEQLRKIEALERQLEGLRPLLADSEAHGKQLCDVLNDQGAKHEIQNKLTSVGKQYTNLQKKLDNKKAEIENLLRDGQKLQETCSKTVGWLSDELRLLSEKLSISANRSVLQQQLNTCEPIYRNITIHEHEIIMLLNKGRESLVKKPQKQLQQEIEKIQKNWDKLKKEIVDRFTRLQTCMEHCKKYYQNQEQFLPWLMNAESSLDMLRPSSFQRKLVEKQLKDLQSFRSDVWRKSGEYETLKMLGDTFLSACDIDKNLVEKELIDMKNRWDNLNDNLMKLLQIFEDILSKLIDFNDVLRDLSHQVQRFEDRHSSINDQSAKDPKILKTVESLLSEIGILKSGQLKVCQKQANDLINEAKKLNVKDATEMSNSVKCISNRVEDLENNLNDKCKELKSAHSVYSDVSNTFKKLTGDLSQLESDLENMKPVARDFKTLRSQFDEINGLLVKLENTYKEITKLSESINKMSESGFSLDVVQVEPLKRQFNKIELSAKNRQNDVTNTIDKMEKFYLLQSNIMEDIKSAENKLDSMKPISSEIESIRTQQSDFKKLRNSVIEPISKLTADCNRCGTGLIQTAANNVSTLKLEEDLDQLQEKWNKLKERLSERERKLDAGLLQFGKFQEALEGQMKWLKDIEEMIENQKPPSADYNVVKAQLQEQKFLKKILLDRQSSLSSLFLMGNEIADDLNVSDKKAIEKDIKDLKSRFNMLSENAQKRLLDLEQAMHVAKQFQDKLISFEEWLNKTEKKIKDFEQVPTDEDKINEKINDHDTMHKDILAKKSQLMSISEIAFNLKNLVGEDEAVTLTDKFNEVSKRYNDLLDHSDRITSLLSRSKSGLRHLVLTYKDLVTWMEDADRKLSKFKNLAILPDKLIEQTENLVTLTEVISTRQKDVDSTLENGAELMKHIASDEALQLKDKLDNVHRKFNELVGKGVDLLNRAQHILPIVQQFHDRHATLSDWMSGAESLTNSVDVSENEIARLEIDISEMRPLLEVLSSLGPQLCQNASNESITMIESLVSKDCRRFEAIVERIQRKAERINLSKQRALEVVTDIDELLEWFKETEQQIREAERASCEPDLARVQLKEHKNLNDDISSQKGRARDILATAKKMLRESSFASSDNTTMIREKIEDLREILEFVSKLSSDRLSILEQALALSEHFSDTHSDLKTWLDEMEHQISMLSKPSLKADLISQQQDKNEYLLQTIGEHKPLIDKLNKTGEALTKLCIEQDAAKIEDFIESDNRRYNALKNELKQRQRELEAALQESSQFSDKLEGMLRAMSNTAEQVNNLEPISVHPPKIRDQISDNKTLIDDLNKRKQAYATVKQAAKDVMNKTVNKSDPAIQDVNKKLGKLEKIWDEIENATNDRSKSLEEALEVAQRFWKQLNSVMSSLKELQTKIKSQEMPATDPKAIEKQKVALQEIKQEIDQTKPEVEKVRSSGKKLTAICGEADKPEVTKHIEDLNHAWDNLTSLFSKREENLIAAMEKAMDFYEILQDLLKFLDRAEKSFTQLGPIGSDIDEVMNQIKHLQKFKKDVDPYMVQVESINRQAHDLTERASSDQAQAIKKPLSEVNRRWESLLHDMIERQQQLENTLLRLGQFQHALNELFVWIQKTSDTLTELKPVLGDVKTTEIEIAKLKVITNDIQAHENSAESLNIAGKQIIEAGDEGSETTEKLMLLNKNWDNLIRKSEEKQRELEDALHDAQVFQAEIQDLISWLNDVDGLIAASKPVGGLPETASEQLERFMEIFSELEQTTPKIETVLQQGQEYVRKTGSGNSNSNLQQSLKNLKTKWDAILAKANDKKIKLEIALKEATGFHDSLQSFIDWLTSAEKTVTTFKSVSRVMNTIVSQIEEHKVLQKDIGSHRETMLNLEKKGAHLKYFSQKQDVILIKNLLISVQHRWERVVARVGERTRAIDHGYKEAKEFHDSWSSLIHWLADAEKILDESSREADSGNASNIKSKLHKHQDLQQMLGSKQSFYDSVMKFGKQLKEKASKVDEPVLRDMLHELKTKWNSVCSKCVDRQRNLEEALLFSGQLSDAINALMAWLKTVQKDFNSNKNVHGDLDTVNMIFDEHKAFEKELKARESQIESVMKSGREIEAKVSDSEFSETHQNLVTIEELWSSVTNLTESKTQNLNIALHDAENLHKSVHMLIDWLSEAEQRLRFLNSLPDDEIEASNFQSELDKFLFELDEKEHVKNETLDLAQSILEKAHPNAVTIIKNWIKVIQTRWEEISSWAYQKEEKLQLHMKSLHDLDDVLEELLKWLSGLETTLTTLKKEPLPESVPALESLISDHRCFMENTMLRQNEVNGICKSKLVKPAKESKKMSRLRTPLRSSQLDLCKESSLPTSNGTLNRKQQRSDNKSNEYSCDPYPHIGPKFTHPDSEPEFKTQRVKMLWCNWKNVWVLSWDRQKTLYAKLEHLKEVERVRNFSWDEWRKRFLKFMNHKKSRLTDLFRKMDKDNNGLIPREDFIDGIIKTRFETSRLEMNAVSDLFDKHNNGLIDWEEFIAALRPDWVEKKDTDAEKIHDEVKRLVMMCTCRQKFKVFQVGEGKYRFGESQKLRLVRILRSTVMVRVGGGWVALDEFLIKNDPCRVALVYPLPNPQKPEEHEAWCFFAEEYMKELMPIFEKVRANEELPCAYPIQVGVYRLSVFSGNNNQLFTCSPNHTIRERSQRSQPMSSNGKSRSSASASTPDSLSDNENAILKSWRRTPVSNRATPCASRSGSRPNSRPPSRASSKPPSRYASTNSLDSIDTPTRIPRKSSVTSLRSKLSVENGINSSRRPSLTSPSCIPRSTTATKIIKKQTSTNGTVAAEVPDNGDKSPLKL